MRQATFNRIIGRYTRQMIQRAMLLCLLPVICIAETYRVTATTFYNSFHHRHPVLQKIKPLDTVITQTIDASGRNEKGELVGAPSNPLTGPFYVEGAAPGDAIAVTFRRIRMNRNWGYSNYRLGVFSLTPAAIETLYPNRYKEGVVIPGRSNAVPWDLDLANGMARLREPRSKLHPMEFPARPMLGCVGVAAPGDFGPSSAISGPYGGNMDYNEIVEGATIVLPVFHSGALLFLGDGHALQADGEPTGTGIETSMDVEFTIVLRKAANLSNPRLETADYIASIGSQPEFTSPLDRALQIATTDMTDWLTKEYKLEPWAAHLLVGYQGKYDIVTVAGSVALRLSRKSLPASQ
jgi:amidase